MSEIQRTLNTLQSIVDKLQLINANTLFFSLLRDAAELILRNPVFKNAIKLIDKKGSKAIQCLKPFAKEALSELKAHENKIRNYITNRDVVDPTIMQLLDTFQDRLIIYHYPHTTLLVPLERAIYMLLNDETFDNSDFIKTFGKINHINNDKYIATSEAFPKFYAWEKETLYLAQTKQTTDWYSLNQIMVFFERHDFRHYDNLNVELIKNGTDITKLQNEHNTLIMYTTFGKALPSNVFPSTEEYKYYIMRIIESIKEIAPPVDEYVSGIRDYKYNYNETTGELKINNEPPIKFKINSDPAHLLKAVMQSKKKTMMCVAAYNKLWCSKHEKQEELEQDDLRPLRGVVRQINTRIKSRQKPDFFIIQESKIDLNQYEILISTSYKPI